ncbi:hypothetical protein ACFPRL_32240 [Pseudoclavibacter helvolus]
MRAAAARSAALPGGMRSLRRCGRPGVADAIAMASSAVTWPLSRIVTPRPGSATWWRATTVPDAVAMSMMSAPSRCRTSTFAAASSGGTE